MRALITGVTGFAGRALAMHLLEAGWQVIGSHGDGRAVPPELRRTGMSCVTHALRDSARMAALVREAAPDVVVHLAGRTGIDFSGLVESHVLATATLLDAVRLHAPEARVVIPGSSAQFGDVTEDRQPIRETTPYAPGTLYGVAKAAEAWTAECYYRQHGLRIIRTHTFNCMGPGQRAGFVPATFAAQIAAIERGERPPVLLVGNLSSRRDLTDIRDVARAYALIATAGSVGGVYNICSSEPVSIGGIVERLCRMARVPIEVRQDPARLQAVDVPTQRGDLSHLQRDTGWNPTVLLEQTLIDVLEEWRAAV